jgi:hypothetical protein
MVHEAEADSPHPPRHPHSLPEYSQPRNPGHGSWLIESLAVPSDPSYQKRLLFLTVPITSREFRRKQVLMDRHVDSHNTNTTPRITTAPVATVHKNGEIPGVGTFEAIGSGPRVHGHQAASWNSHTRRDLIAI